MRGEAQHPLHLPALHQHLRSGRAAGAARTQQEVTRAGARWGKGRGNARLGKMGLCRPSLGHGHSSAPPP